MNNFDEKDFIIEQFYKVKELGFVRSNRPNNTGIGKTFEDYVGVVENNYEQPDLAGYEIKSHRKESNNYVTLFTKSPSFPRGANKHLRDKFGVEKNGLKVLHTSIFANKSNTFLDTYSFRLINDKSSMKIIIEVRDNTGKLLDNSCGYNYEAISYALETKLSKLFYVKADRKKADDGTELFHFNYAELYSQPSISTFLKLLDEGLIMYDIRIGSYSSGKNYGKPHDHGSGFRILEKNLHLLYDSMEIVK